MLSHSATKFLIFLAALLLIVLAPLPATAQRSPNSSMPPNCNMSYNYRPAFSGQTFSAQLPDGVRLDLTFHADNYVFWRNTETWKNGSAAVTDHLHVPRNLYIEWTIESIAYRLIPTDCDRRTMAITEGKLTWNSQTTTVRAVNHVCGRYWYDYVRSGHKWLGYQYMGSGYGQYASSVELRFLSQGWIDLILGSSPSWIMPARIGVATTFNPDQKPDPRTDIITVRWNLSGKSWESTNIACDRGPQPVVINGDAFDKERRYSLVSVPTGTP